MNVILVIAEDHGLREALRNALPESHLLLFEASLDEAARRLVSLPADIILVDDAPRLGGRAIEPVKAMAPGTPVIVLASRGDVVTQAGLTRAGADAVIVKPFNYEALQEAIAVRTAPVARAPGLLEARESGHARSTVLNQHQMALRWISRAALYSDDEARLSQSLVESAADIFDAVRCAVLLERSGAVQVAASFGIPDAITGSLRLSYASGMMRWFDVHACLIDPKTAHDPLAVKELQLLNARLAAPLLRNGRVFGAIVLGEKASGLDYVPEERELLTLVARTTSITFERAHAHADTSREQSRLDRIFAQMDAGVATVGPEKTVTMINAQAARLLRVKASETVGRSVQKLGSSVADVVLRALAAGEPVRQTVFERAAGARFDLSVTPLGEEGVVAVFNKAAEESVSTEDIAYSPFWEYLSSRVGQEVKNPMVAINTFAQLLPRKYDSEDFRDAFSRVVQEEVARINRVVETLFEFARNPSLKLQRADVNEAVRSVLKTFEDELAARSITVEAAWEQDRLDADIDLAYFQKAVQHVVQNSIDAMPEGGALRISTKRSGNRAEVSIGDSGAGVSNDDEGLIFLPFYSTKEKGMGLGLPLAERIVKQHRGSLKLAAAPGHGARFTIELPAPAAGQETLKPAVGDSREHRFRASADLSESSHAHDSGD